MAEFFAMGGYAAYVWPAWGVAAVVLVTLLIVSWRTLRSREATLKALEGNRPRRRRGRAAADTNSATPLRVVTGGSEG